MINVWEAVQGLVFMVALGLLTRGAVGRRGYLLCRRRRRSSSSAVILTLPLPTPRETGETRESTEA